MTEGTIIAIITQVTSVVTLLVTWLIKRTQNKATVMRQELNTKVDKIQQDTGNIQKQVNGKMDRLIEHAKESSKEQGRIEGRAELKRELNSIPIIVLDDDTDIHFFLERDVLRPLKNPNYHFYSDEDKFIEEIRPGAAVYIVDHLLGKRDGLEIVDIINETNPDNFIILYSGTDNKRVIGTYLNDDSADVYIGKDDEDANIKLKKYVLIGLKQISMKAA